MTSRSIALWVLERQVGTFYTWGGDDPSGFDCSGLVVEILKAAGRFPRKKDATAHALMHRYSLAARDEVRPGDLALWVRHGDERAIHVEVVWDVEGAAITTVGASGGGSRTKTREDAIRDNAYIKVRPLTPRLSCEIVYRNPYGD